MKAITRIPRSAKPARRFPAIPPAGSRYRQRAVGRGGPSCPPNSPAIVHQPFRGFDARCLPFPLSGNPHDPGCHNPNSANEFLTHPSCDLDISPDFSATASGLFAVQNRGTTTKVAPKRGHPA